MNRLKIGFYVMITAFIATSCMSGYNVIHINKDTKPGKKAGFYYSLPQTYVKVDVKVEQIEKIKGPYAEYANKYLGLQNIIKENMKKLIILLTLLLSACAPIAQQVAIPTAQATPTPIPQPKSCTVWSMQWWKNIGNPWDGSFSQFVACPNADPNSGCGVSANFVTLNTKWIEATKRLNVGSAKPYSWAAANDHPPLSGLVFQYNGIDVNTSVNWNRIAPASKDSNNLNFVCVSQIQNGYAEIVGLPSSVNPDLYSDVVWAVQNVFGNYGSQPLLYKIYTLDGCSGFPISKGGCGTWVSKEFLYKMVGTALVPWNNTIATDTPTPTPDITPTPTQDPTPTPTPTPAPPGPPSTQRAGTR